MKQFKIYSLLLVTLLVFTTSCELLEPKDDNHSTIDRVFEQPAFAEGLLIMTKADLASCIYSTANISKKDAADVLEEVFTIMKDTLASGEKIKIAGFGNFEVNQKRARKGRNPQTGEAIIIEARRVLTFKVSTVLKQDINREC